MGFEFKIRNMERKSFIIVLMIVIVSLESCIDHGEYITTVQPAHIDYDKYAMQWVEMPTIFYYDIYKKDYSYIAIYKSSDGKVNEDELTVLKNSFYGRNHPTSKYQYNVQDWYFNINE